jgi:hypothetical protein
VPADRGGQPDGQGDSVGYHVPDVYRKLLELERADDPWHDGEPVESLALMDEKDWPPKPWVLMRSTLRKLLLAGEPVVVGHIPDVPAPLRGDRSVTGWQVTPDDMVTPLRGGEDHDDGYFWELEGVHVASLWDPVAGAPKLVPIEEWRAAVLAKDPDYWADR